MIDMRCDLCAAPTDGYCCRRCADSTAEQLRYAELADEVQTTVARLARYAHRGAHRATLADGDEKPTADLPGRRQPVSVFGWPASVTRPGRGALRAQRLPVDLVAASRAADAYATLSHWTEVVLADHGGRLAESSGGHPAVSHARYLLCQLDWIRHQHFAAECFDQLRAAGTTIHRIVDTPPERRIVGRCDCREYLYAYADAVTVTCTGCGLRWDVEASRSDLREALLGRLVTAAEAGDLLVIFGMGGTRRRIAKTITMWSQRRLITRYPPIESGGDPLFLFADVFDRVASSRWQSAA